MKKLIESTQQLGRALMLPIAVLPVAGLLLRLGQPDLMNLAPVAAAGDAIFSNLGILFAIGVAVGLARENNGAAGLAAVVGFLVATKGAEVLIQVPPDVLAKGDLAAAAHKVRQLAKLSVPIGIISGLLSGWFYNRYADIRLPSYLAFFGGRRFVPIVAGCAGLVVAAVFGLGWPFLEAGMDGVSRGVIAAGEVGLFVFGVLNRLLIVTGLHHILNNVAWFLVGDYNGVTGDLKRFFAGDPSAGMFMSGFFPVMMFGLPAACLAMYRTALPARRRAVGGLLLSMGLTSFLTGVTEPIEFTFMFLAPFLFVVHAILTGAALVTMDMLNSKLGFGFSAGLFDYVLNFNKATHPLYLIPVGAAYFAIYYVAFHFCIVRFNLKTPGRETEEAVPPTASTAAGDGSEADRFIAALGGAENLRNVDACTTRLRLVVADRGRVDEAALKTLGARGTVKLGDDGLQVVLGPIADQVAGNIRQRLAAMRTSPATVASAISVANSSTTLPTNDAADTALATRVLVAAGGASNVREVAGNGERVLLLVADAKAVDEKALAACVDRGAALRGMEAHLLHSRAESLCMGLRVLVKH